MASTQSPAPGTDFWAALGVSEESAEQQIADDPQEADPADTSAVHARDEWASMFADPPGPDAEKPESAPPRPAEEATATPPTPPTPEPSTPAAQPTPNAAEPIPPTSQPTPPAPEPTPPTPELSPAATEPTPPTPEPTSRAAEPTPPTAQPTRAAASNPQWAARQAKGRTAAADPAWIIAERIADSLRSRMAFGLGDDPGQGNQETWLEVLTRYTGGDSTLVNKVYDVMSGWHLLGALWHDDSVNEVHIRGTQVTVCTKHGIHQVPGFPSLASARRTIETITAAQQETGAVITEVGGSVVVQRRFIGGPDAADLIAAGVLTEDQMAQVERALADTQAVTVSGPAAPVVIRALAPLVPAGSRIFEGPFAVLPAGCVTAPSPLDADFVLGVRPGRVAEEMAAAGQLGALIANPETRFPAAVRLTVSGRSATPGKITAAH